MVLKKINFTDNKSSFVDIDYIKAQYETGRLVGANVFARLFGICNDELFKGDCDDEINLQYFDVSESQWRLLFSFIRIGVLPIISVKINYIKDLDICFNLTIKLGGIPAFETFYDSQVKLFGKHQNPMTPQEDEFDLYRWRAVSYSATLNPNESITCCASKNENVFYARNLK